MANAMLYERPETPDGYWQRSERCRITKAQQAAVAAKAAERTPDGRPTPRAEYWSLVATLQRRRPYFTLFETTEIVEATERGATLKAELDDEKQVLRAERPTGFFNRERLAAVCAHLKPQLAAYFQFAYFTGWPRGEIAALQPVASGRLRAHHSA